MASGIPSGTITLENHDHDDYDEEEDEDFTLDPAVGGENATSSEDSESEADESTTKHPSTSSRPRKRKRTGDPGEAGIDLGFENSGDEGIIKEGAKQERKRKSRKKGDEQREETTGDDGLFVQTRSMRAAAAPSTSGKLSALMGKVTADIDSIWARLNAGSIAPRSSKPEDEAQQQQNAEDEEMITISRTYTFAGKVHQETRTVARSSAQAQAYLATKDQRAKASEVQNDEVVETVTKDKLGPDGQVLSQPKRRISLWDPNPNGFIKGLPTIPTVTKSTSTGNVLKIISKAHLGNDAQLWHRVPLETLFKANAPVLQPGQAPMPLSALTKQLRIQKLNVVDKSKLDWAEHVDASGSREELEQAKKDKSNYLARRDFLTRVEDKAEDERARARAVVR